MSIKNYISKIPIISEKENSLFVYFGVLIFLLVPSTVAYIIDPELINLVIPIVLTFSSLLVTLRFSYFSNRNFSYFVSIMIAILSYALSLMIYLQNSTISIILPIGFVLVALTLTYYYHSLNTIDTRYILGLLIIILFDGTGLIISFILNDPNMMLNGVLLMIIMGLYLYDFFSQK